MAEYLLPSILAELCESVPQLRIELVVSNQVVSLAQREADIALRVTDKPDANLKGRRLGNVEMAVYAARPGESCDLSSLPWVGFDAALACSGPARWLSAHVPDAEIRFRANTLLGAAQAVRSGIGRGVLPCFVAGRLGDLVRCSPTIPELSVGLWILVHPEMARVPRIRAATDALAERLRAAQPLLAGDA